MGEKPKTQKFVYIVAVSELQAEVDKEGFTAFLNRKREELKKQFGTNQVFIVAV